MQIAIHETRVTLPCVSNEHIREIQTLLKNDTTIFSENKGVRIFSISNDIFSKWLHVILPRYRLSLCRHFEHFWNAELTTYDEDTTTWTTRTLKHMTPTNLLRTTRNENITRHLKSITTVSSYFRIYHWIKTTFYRHLSRWTQKSFMTLITQQEGLFLSTQW